MFLMAASCQGTPQFPGNLLLHRETKHGPQIYGWLADIRPANVSDYRACEFVRNGRFPGGAFGPGLSAAPIYP